MEKEAFLPHHRPYQVSLLYMIAQTLYRNRKFTRSLVYLTQLHSILQESPKSTYHHFYPKYLLLLAMNRVFAGSTEEAIRLLEGFLSAATTETAPANWLNARLNLAFCYFQREDYRQANQVLLSIPHSDRWCEKKMGKEWVLKKALSELIIQYELGHVDLALLKIRSIERTFHELLRVPAYTNVRTYLEFIKKLISQPGSVTDTAFSEQVSQAFHFLPVEQEDLQAMNFYAWLKSKMVRRPYYPVLLELVSTADEAKAIP